MDQDDINFSEQANQKERVINEFARILEAFAMDAMEPDIWIANHLTEAFNWLARGGYKMASACVADAMVPENERSARVTLPSDVPPNMNLALLLRLLDTARQEPTRPHAHLGPIVYDGQQP